MVKKIETENEEFDYKGRIADRQTEEDYTHENLMQVSVHLVSNLLTQRIIVRLKICRQSKNICTWR